MRNAFYELISGLHTAEERTVEPEDMSVETFPNRKATKEKGMGETPEQNIP